MPSDEMFTLHLLPCVQYATLTLLILEWLSFFDDELIYIWKRPMSFIRTSYIFSRYFAIASQIFSYAYFSRNYTISQYPVPSWFCRSFYGIAVSQSLQLVLEIILVVRVHALYNRSRRMGFFLSTLFIANTSLMITMVCLSIRTIEFDSVCTLLGTPRAALYYGCGEALTQTTILCLTLWKPALSPVGRLPRNPLVALLLRDGAAVFTTIDC